MSIEIMKKTVINDADWDEIKRMMDVPYGAIKLCCDGYDLSLVQHVSSKRKTFETVVYVNGNISGAWWEADEHGNAKYEEAKRFWMRRTRQLRSAGTLKNYEKAFGKRARRKIENEKIVFFEPVWRSFNSLKKHLISHNREILIVRD